MEESIRIIDFKDFPTDERFVQIEGKLFMADNIVGLPGDEESVPVVTPQIRIHHAPVQVNMTLIFICLEGSLHMDINLQKIELRPMMVATVLQGSFMQIEEMTDFRGAVVAIASGFMSYSEDVRASLDIYQHFLDAPVATMDAKALREMLELYSLMKRKLMDTEFSYRSQVAKAFLDIIRYNGLHSLKKSGMLAKTTALHSRKDELFRLFVQTVKQYYREQHRLNFYAEKLCVTPKYLSKTVHIVSGKFATDWIDAYLMLDAMAMLKNSDKQIKAVAVDLGFQDPSSFAKYFKQHAGITPTEYRQEKTE